MNINEKLATIQTKFKSKKSRFNSFGKYNFRSAEDILEATKPFLLELGVSVTINEELNTAFEFLDNPTRKKKLDGAGQQAKQKEQSQEYEPDNDSEEFNKASNALQKNWDFACEYHPELLKLHADLRKLNARIAFLFMAVIVEEKLYADASNLAEYLEDQFLISKFSEDPDIKKIAKYAILKKEIKFAQDLNRALKILGEGSKEKILQKLVLDYPEIGYHALKEAELDRYIPNNNPLRQKENALRAASYHNRHRADRDAINRLEKEDKINKSTDRSLWFLSFIFFFVIFSILF